MLRILKILIAIGIGVSILITTAEVAAAQTTTNPSWKDFIWPLCGRIKEELGDAWDDAGTSCDYATRIEQQGKTDFPIQHGFGYRNFNDTSRAISFHRGLDLATPGNEHRKDKDNPVFAAASGYVKSITCDGGTPNDSSDPCLSDRDYKVVLLHPANGASQCSNSNPCRITVYDHLRNDVNVKVNDCVNKGQHIAWTGTSREGNFDHLHFEIRDPYLRASAIPRNTSGRFSYAKDARNPMFYLPYPKLTGTEPFDIEISETPSVRDDVDVWVILNADSGYNLNLKSVTLTAYNGSIGSAERQFIDQSSTDGTYVNEYVVNNNVFEVDDWSMQHTPFPSSSSKWDDEKDENPHFENTNPDGPDFFLEKNAGDSISGGKRYADFDYKLITAAPHDTASTGNAWYQLKIGFTGIEPASSGTQRCYKADVVTTHPVNGDSQQSVERCFM